MQAERFGSHFSHIGLINPISKHFQNRLYICHPHRLDRADCLSLIGTGDEMNRVIISSGNSLRFGIALIRLGKQ